MRDAFGYLATTITARQVLAGTYKYPNWFDEATKELCLECAAIRLGVPPRSVATTIRHQEWSSRWSKAKEKTSSSESGLHFGHYKAACQSSILSHIHALKTSLSLRRDVALDRWSRGLSVMLEKMYGCTLISKLRAILLMEADFNFSNKVVYGVRMMDNVWEHGFMPEETYSEKVGRRTMARWQKCSSTTSYARRGCLRALVRLMLQIATTASHMPSPHWFSRPLECQRRQFAQC